MFIFENFFKIVYNGCLLFDGRDSNFGLFLIYMTALGWTYTYLFFFGKVIKHTGIRERTGHGLTYRPVIIMDDIIYLIKGALYVYYTPGALYHTCIFVEWLHAGAIGAFFLDQLIRYDKPYTISAYSHIIGYYYILITLMWVIMSFIIVRLYKRYYFYFIIVTFIYFKETLGRVWFAYKSAGIFCFFFAFILVGGTLIVIAVIIFGHNIGFFGDSLHFIFGAPFSKDFIAPTS